jgi:tetratricopeptide (TPR) repeat protein
MQELSAGPHQARGAQVSERSRKALEEAERLYKANDLKGAIKLLEPIAADDDAEVSLLLRLGELCAYALDFKATDKWFRRVIERADRSGEPLPRDHIMIGKMLYSMKRYREAIPILEAGWRLGGRRIDSYYVIILARSYEATGAMRSAQQAYQTVLASDPGNVEAWSALSRIEAKTATGAHAPPGPDVPAPPRLKEFNEVISFGDPRKWSYEESVKGIAAYKRYAEALEHSDVILSIRADQRATAQAAVKPCFERPDDHSIDRSMNCIRSIARMTQTRPINTFDTTYQRFIYLSLFVVHTDMGQFVHALSNLEHFVSLPAIEEWADDVKIVDSVLG